MKDIGVTAASYSMQWLHQSVPLATIIVTYPLHRTHDQIVEIHDRHSLLQLDWCMVGSVSIHGLALGGGERKTESPKSLGLARLSLPLFLSSSNLSISSLNADERQL